MRAENQVTQKIRTEIELTPFEVKYERKFIEKKFDGLSNLR